MLSPLEPKVAELMSKCLQGQMESAQQYLSKPEKASASDQLSAHMLPVPSKKQNCPQILWCVHSCKTILTTRMQAMFAMCTVPKQQLLYNSCLFDLLSATPRAWSNAFASSFSAWLNLLLACNTTHSLLSHAMLYLIHKRHSERQHVQQVLLLGRMLPPQ